MSGLLVIIVVSLLAGAALACVIGYVMFAVALNEPLPVERMDPWGES